MHNREYQIAIDVWTIPLYAQVDTETKERICSVLTESEIHRLKRFHFKQDANVWACARFGMRSILATYTHQTPKRINFSLTEFGKPGLADYREIKFNLSHSGNMALLTVFDGRNTETDNSSINSLDIGVDIEQRKPITDMDDVVSRFYSPQEKRAYFDKTGLDKLTNFYQTWTKKEALLKATGVGITNDLPNWDSLNLNSQYMNNLDIFSNGVGNNSIWLDVIWQDKDYIASLAVMSSAPLEVQLRNFCFDLAKTHRNAGF